MLVHGVAQQYRGPESVLAACLPAMRDGVLLAGGELAAGDVSVAFYGDLFRPAGGRGADGPDYDVSDVDDPVELALLQAWWQEAARIDPAVPGPDEPSRARTPQWVQRAVYALSGLTFFAGLAERALIGSLKQVRAYLTDADVRATVQARVRAAITGDCRVLIGHSLGSVVGYEVLSAASHPPVPVLVTLGSPLGVPNLIFDRLLPPPQAGVGAWPPSVRRWVNITDRGDVVALAKRLSPRFGQVVDVLVDNGARAHDVRPYLTAAETGRAIMAGLSG
jgi:hypothetical protein